MASDGQTFLVGEHRVLHDKFGHLSLRTWLTFPEGPRPQLNGHEEI